MIDAKLHAELIAIRRDLHQYPELGGSEYRTGDKICAFLDGLGISYRRGVAQTGVVAEIPGGNNEGAWIALRADMDALPIKEETGLPFASRVDGLMHACGHDGHTSMLLGAAALLGKEPSLPAPVRLIFQPAEETGMGAKAMIGEGVLDGVALILGGHVDRHYPVGTIVVSKGVVNASSDGFDIRITGRGGHAARPHEAVDAVVVGSLLVMAIQTIVSREVNPAHPSVVTVGRFEAGSAPNVIAGQARLEGSIRAQDANVREHLHGAIERIARSIGQLHGATMEIQFHPGTPPLVNSDTGVRIARRAAALVVGKDHVRRLETANMGGEDFSYYVQHVDGCYVRFGATRPGAPAYPAHSSKFDFDEEALAVGAAYYHAAARLAGTLLCRTDRTHPLTSLNRRHD
jgi:hippurate hydrolase